MRYEYLIRLGRVVAEERRGIGLSQAALAELCGINRRHYQNIEAGRVDLRVSTLMEIAKGLGISAAVLIERCERNLGSPLPLAS